MTSGPRRAAGRVLLASALGAALVPVLTFGAGPAAADVCPAAGGVGTPEAPIPANAEVAVLGHGYGHSVGMSQYGAQGAALLGCGYDDILRTYYPGLSPAMTALPSDSVLVEMLTDGGAGGYATLFAEGGPVTWTTGTASVVQPQGSTWTVRPDGLNGQLVQDAAAVPVPGLAASPGVPVHATHDGVVARLTTYKTTSAGAVLSLDRRSDHDYVRFTASGAGLTARWMMNVADYLRGIAEMPSSWTLAAQEAQIIAARSYLVGQYKSGENGFSILPTPTDQNWTGASKQEDDARNGGRLAQAVAETTSGTSGVVMVDAAGNVARSLLYTSSHGGWSERADYSYTTAVDHLRQVDDSRWDQASGNPNTSWAVGLTFAQLARAFGFDTVTSVSVPPQGDPSRTVVTVTGTRAGVVTAAEFHGMDARARLQSVAGPAVKSPGFTFRVLTIGGDSAVPLTGDWDGTGGEELGWFRNGAIVLRRADGTLVRYHYGRKGDVPVVGDWNGDGTDSVGVVRGNAWFLRDAQAGGPADTTFSFGRKGDRPVVGRWPGAVAEGIGVVRGNAWFLRGAVAGGAADGTFSWGRKDDVPLVGDWNGDGTETPGLKRGGEWFLSDATTPVAVAHHFLYGRPDDRPVVADWDGNASQTPGVVRDLSFFLRNDLAGGAGTARQDFAG